MDVYEPIIYLLLDDEDENILPHILRLVDVNYREVGPCRLDIGVNIELWRTLGDPSFREHFRMTRTTFDRLVVALGHHLQTRNQLQRLRTGLDISAMMSVWILATSDTFRSTAIKFGVSKGVVFFHYVRTIKALSEMAGNYIKWPNALERERIRVNFERRYGYPGVIGVIDGTHIKITKPRMQAPRYMNRHHSYSILAQAVCDDQLLYRDVYVGQPGSVGDARMFARSPLGVNLFRRPQMIGPDEHILGDSAYPLSSKLLIPYTDDGHLDEVQRHHNYTLSSCRMSIERSFALLKVKLRRILTTLQSYNIEYANYHIMASFVLHNIIILEGEDMDLLGDEPNLEDDQPVDELVDLHEAMEAGAVRREYIANLVFPHER